MCQCLMWGDDLNCDMISAFKFDTWQNMIFFHSFKCQCLMLSSYVRCAAKLWYDEWLFNHDDLAKKIEGQNLTLDEIWIFFIV